MNFLEILTIIPCVFLAICLCVGVVAFIIALTYLQVMDAQKEGTACRPK